ncbi:iron transporter [Schaalia sp. 19OD2882]|uniref:iron transporter n=1 Tax=Schaalia sp. 19OD2882 TaxID=2794089 RepID=UPI001C1EA218|nr:iron transporter [Schaalia sp. 19OD2882]QWW19841.1 iron transporter [Schaalia sp. 19OD2882]
MKQSLTSIGAAAAALALVAGLSACSSGTAGTEPQSTPQSSSSAAAAPGEDAGFDEFPLGDDVFSGPLKISGVYFQPVDMEPQIQTPAKDASMHIEADISAVQGNDLGYGVGDFIPGLKVDYKVLGKDGKAVLEGTFMPMNASDGPHYGLNLPKLDAGTYTVQFIVHSPEENGWLLHTDETTGVKGRFWTEPIVAEFKDWKWDPTAVEW